MGHSVSQKAKSTIQIAKFVYQLAKSTVYNAKSTARVPKKSTFQIKIGHAQYCASGNGKKIVLFFALLA